MGDTWVLSAERKTRNVTQSYMLISVKTFNNQYRKKCREGLGTTYMLGLIRFLIAVEADLVGKEGFNAASVLKNNFDIDKSVEITDL